MATIRIAVDKLSAEGLEKGSWKQVRTMYVNRTNGGEVAWLSHIFRS